MTASSRTEKTWRNFLNDGSSDWSDYSWGSISVTLQEVVVIALGDQAIGDLVDLKLLKAARAQYSRFFGRCYADTNSDWTVSEHAIYYNANLAFVLALAEASFWGPAF